MSLVLERRVLDQEYSTYLGLYKLIDELVNKQVDRGQLVCLVNLGELGVAKGDDFIPLALSRYSVIGKSSIELNYGVPTLVLRRPLPDTIVG